MRKERTGRGRGLVVAGCGLLASGIAMLTLSGGVRGVTANWIHGVAGLLLGLSIGLNLIALRYRRCTLDSGSKQ